MRGGPSEHVCVEVKGQLVEIGSLLLRVGRGNHQAWGQVPLPAELFGQHKEQYSKT